MTAKHMETQREVTRRWILNLMSEWPKIALCSKHWQTVLFSGIALLLCQAALEADAQTSYWLFPNILKTSICVATESNTQTQVLQMCSARAAQFLVCFPPNTYHLFYFRGNLVRAKPQGDRTEGEIEQFPPCCIVAYEAVYRQGKRAPRTKSIFLFPRYLLNVKKQHFPSDLRPAPFCDEESFAKWLHIFQH